MGSNATSPVIVAMTPDELMHWSRSVSYKRESQILAGVVCRQQAEIKQLREFIRADYNKFEEYHPHARELLRMYPWLQKADHSEKEFE